MTDPIADMLTRIRNAIMRNKDSVEIPRSTLKTGVSNVLKEEGFIKEYKEIEDGKQGILKVYLKYGSQKEPVIHGLSRESKPGRNIYKKLEEIKPVLGGIGVAIYSTDKGVLSDKECRKAGVGGQFICKVW
ncbi:MAG TPA: 30S ribosomal protein S8 [Candidatus Hypogeohydataceae bacterium YC41]